MKSLIFKIELIVLFLIKYLINVHLISQAEIPNKCAQRIHNGCTDKYRPTELEIEKARIYIQNKFLNDASHKPTSEPCQKLRIRRNFKCMTHEERMRVINVLRQLYANGFMWRLTQIHSKCWPSWHKSLEAFSGHRWIMNKLEMEMLKIDPFVTLPYWIISEDCTQPQESLIWRYFGTYGTNSTEFCVDNCPFAAQTRNRCIKREWNQDGTIPPWSCPEIDMVASYVGINLGILNFLALGQHFHQHLNIGGWNGHYSETFAPYDFVFHLQHNYYTECFIGKWQLSDKSYLTPDSYNSGNHFDVNTQQSLSANLTDDKLCHYNTPVVDTWHLGFGEQCSVCDQLVQTINRQLNNQIIKNDQISRLLPNNIRTNLLPINLKTGLLQWFYSSLPNETDCNPKCLPMPKVIAYTDNDNGRRQLAAMEQVWNVNMSPAMQLADFLLRLTIKMYNMVGFCSAYVTTPTNEQTIQKEYTINDVQHDYSTIIKNIIMVIRKLTGDNNTIIE